MLVCLLSPHCIQDLDNVSVADAAHPGGGRVGAAGEGDAAQGSDEKDENGKKNKTRDVGRFRVSSFEKQRRAVTNIKTEAANACRQVESPWRNTRARMISSAISLLSCKCAGLCWKL